MTFTGSSASSVNSAAGKVLAVSPNVTLANSSPATLVVLSDIVDVPNQVFIYNTTSHTAVSFLMDNAVAAAFSPDGLKAYIVSGSSCPGTASAGCLLVSSTIDAAQTIPLAAPATDVAFIGEGSLGYFAGGDPAGTAFLPTCFDPALSGSLGSVNLASQLIRPLPDGQSALALAPPNVQEVTAALTGIPVLGVDGCPAPRGFLTINNAVGTAFNLGVGSFTPTQFIISPDGSSAYILGEIPQTPPNPPLRFPFIIVFNLATQTPSNISLAGNAVPLTASLTPTGDLLFVGADDGAVHVIDTATLADTQQITFPFPANTLCYGPGTPPTQAPVTCRPDLVAVKP
jgi:WD40 repeat protein